MTSIVVVPWRTDGRWGYRAFGLFRSRVPFGVRGPLPFVLGVLSRVAYREIAR